MPQLLLDPFSKALNCSRASRVAVELLHISKSGGTSMCRLAVETGGLRNSHAEMLDNCLVSALPHDLLLGQSVHSLTY